MVIGYRIPLLGGEMNVGMWINSATQIIDIFYARGKMKK